MKPAMATLCGAALVGSLLGGAAGRQLMGLRHDSSNAMKTDLIEEIRRYKVYTFWDYPRGPSPFVTLNLKTWRRHLPPGTEVVFVNNTNFFDLVPDAPKYWNHMPDYGSKSDMVRAAVLYHQGGIYMDTDFLVMGSLEEVMMRLNDGWDVIAYADQMGQQETGPCNMSKSFSSNFIAGRKGNAFHGTWWKNMLMKLNRLCAERDYENEERVCCQQAFDDWKEGSRGCKVPWGYLEHMKQPECDYDIDHPKRPHQCPRPLPPHFQKKPLSPDDPARQTPEAQLILQAVKEGRKHAATFPKSTRVMCLAGREGLAPHINGEVYWQPWDAKAGVTASNESKDPKRYEFRELCREERDGNLTCDHGNWGKQRRNFSNFFHRPAYHLFFTMHVDKVAKTEEEVLEKDWLLSEMYRRALA